MLGIITQVHACGSSFVDTGSSAYVATSDGNNKEAAVSAAVTTSFMPAEIQRLSKQRTEECHRAVSRYLVKGLHPLSTVESPWFR